MDEPQQQGSWLWSSSGPKRARRCHARWDAQFCPKARQRLGAPWPPRCDGLARGVSPPKPRCVGERKARARFDCRSTCVANPDRRVPRIGFGLFSYVDKTERKASAEDALRCDAQPDRARRSLSGRWPSAGGRRPVATGVGRARLGFFPKRCRSFRPAYLIRGLATVSELRRSAYLIRLWKAYQVSLPKAGKPSEGGW